jgi:hypothetical protein
MDKVQKNCFTDYNAPSSEPFRTHLKYNSFINSYSVLVNDVTHNRTGTAVVTCDIQTAHNRTGTAVVTCDIQTAHNRTGTAVVTCDIQTAFSDS